MDQVDTDRVLDQLWIQNHDEVICWFCRLIMVEKTLCKGRSMLDALEREGLIP